MISQGLLSVAANCATDGRAAGQYQRSFGIPHIPFRALRVPGLGGAQLIAYGYDAILGLTALGTPAPMRQSERNRRIQASTIAPRLAAGNDVFKRIRVQQA